MTANNCFTLLMLLVGNIGMLMAQLTFVDLSGPGKKDSKPSLHSLPILYED
jgi:hypothetical protein